MMLILQARAENKTLRSLATTVNQEVIDSGVGTRYEI